jgi:hypothetical protein
MSLAGRLAHDVEDAEAGNPVSATMRQQCKGWRKTHSARGVSRRNSGCRKWTSPGTLHEREHKVEGFRQSHIESDARGTPRYGRTVGSDCGRRLPSARARKGAGQRLALNVRRPLIDKAAHLADERLHVLMAIERPERVLLELFDRGCERGRAVRDVSDDRPIKEARAHDSAGRTDDNRVSIIRPADGRSRRRRDPGR